MKLCHFQDQKPFKFCKPYISNLGNLKNLPSYLLFEIAGYFGNKFLHRRQIAISGLQTRPCHHIFKVMPEQAYFLLHRLQILDIKLLLA